MKAGLKKIPKIEIHLEKPNEKGLLTTPDGRNSIANTGAKDNQVWKEVGYYPNGTVWYVRYIPKEPIQYNFPLGKNEYCYTHLAHHEAVHTIREILETKEIKDEHDERFYQIGNALFPDFEYRDKNLCKECPEKRFIKKERDK